MVAKVSDAVDAIREMIESRTARRIRDLIVEYGRDCITLRGRTHSFHVKQLAQHEVRKILKDVRIENAILVD